MLIPLRQPGSVSLRGLIPSASFVGCGEITVSAVTSHSDECTPGCLFATLPGSRVHGKHFIPQALQRGAAAILTDYPLADVSLPQCIVSDVPQAFGQICHGMYGHPTRNMCVAGVTGTNGKTTTTWILRSLLESASYPTGLIGTVEYSDGVHSESSTLTTPDAMTLARHFAAMRNHGTKHAAMELSSHALDQSRCAGVGLDLAMITNITHDHLDYHKDIDSYIEAKSKIINYIKPGGVLVLNSDCPHWQRFIPAFERKIPTLTYGFGDEADITAEIIEMTSAGSSFWISYGVERIECKTSFIGKHNILNCLAATCAAIHFGLKPEQIREGLARCEAAPGRMEAVNCGQNFQVYVDFAHTEDAIQNVIQAVRPLTNGQVILVFGAGGDRDKAKRAPMGRAAGLADQVVITSDNPRNEQPLDIIHQIMEGFTTSRVKPVIEIDRAVAIHKAINLAGPGDTVLVVGKGHEKYQMIGEDKIPFDDFHHCRAAIRSVLQRQPHFQLPARMAG